MMRAAVLCVLTLASVLTSVAPVPAQQPTRRPTEQTQEKPAEPGPAATPTAEKAAESVKTPSGVRAAPTAAPVDPGNYTIGPEDIISVRVWREDQLSGQHQVRPDGKISIPLINDVEAAGKTPDELRNIIATKLTEFITRPEVYVTVQQVLSRKYYIGGEGAARSGAFPLVVPTTVLEAVTNAGLREFASSKKITILRKGKLIKFNYADVTKGKNMEQNILLENGDFVNIP